MSEDKLCWPLLWAFSRIYLQKESVSQGPRMLHKPAILVYTKKNSEHVTCLFLRFGCKHYLWAWVYNTKKKERESLEKTKRELRENKEQSRTMYNKEDVELFRKTLSDNVFFTCFFVFFFNKNRMSHKPLQTNNNGIWASINTLSHCWHHFPDYSCGAEEKKKNPLTLFASVLHQRYDH